MKGKNSVEFFMRLLTGDEVGHLKVTDTLEKHIEPFYADHLLLPSRKLGVTCLEFADADRKFIIATRKFGSLEILDLQCEAGSQRPFAIAIPPNPVFVGRVNDNFLIVACEGGEVLGFDLQRLLTLKSQAPEWPRGTPGYLKTYDDFRLENDVKRSKEREEEEEEEGDSDEEPQESESSDGPVESSDEEDDDSDSDDDDALSGDVSDEETTRVDSESDVSSDDEEEMTFETMDWRLRLQPSFWEHKLHKVDARFGTVEYPVKRESDCDLSTDYASFTYWAMKMTRKINKGEIVKAADGSDLLVVTGDRHALSLWKVDSNGLSPYWIVPLERDCLRMTIFINGKSIGVLDARMLVVVDGRGVARVYDYLDKELVATFQGCQMRRSGTSCQVVDQLITYVPAGSSLREEEEEVKEEPSKDLTVELVERATKRRQTDTSTQEVNTTFRILIGDNRGGCNLLELSFRRDTDEVAAKRLRREERDELRQHFVSTKKKNKAKIHVHYQIGTLVNANDKYKDQIYVNVQGAFREIIGCIEASAVSPNGRYAVFAGLGRRLFVFKRGPLTWMLQHKINLKQKIYALAIVPSAPKVKIEDMHACT